VLCAQHRISVGLSL
jgi:hypothetical protein